MSNRSSSSDDGTKTVAYIVLLVIAIIFSIWFYSADASGQGKIADKWVESSTSCDDDGDCTTTHSYFVQFSDSRVYRVFWGRMHWDGMISGSYISFEARGRNIYFLTLRIKVSDIFSWQLLSQHHSKVR